MGEARRKALASRTGAGGDQQQCGLDAPEPEALCERSAGPAVGAGDIDASIKPQYGRQEGAETGYNPSKPRRPSHVLRTFLVAHLRMALEVQLSSGKQHTSGHAKTALGRLLDELGGKPSGADVIGPPRPPPTPPATA